MIDDLREAVALLNEARAAADISRDRRRWSRRRYALRARLREWDKLPVRVHSARGDRTVDDIAAMPKRHRTRLAKSELWLVLAVIAEHHLPKYDLTADIARTYDLTGDDLVRLCHHVATELKTRAAKAAPEAEVALDADSVRRAT